MFIKESKGGEVVRGQRTDAEEGGEECEEKGNRNEKKGSRENEKTGETTLIL